MRSCVCTHLKHRVRQHALCVPARPLCCFPVWLPGTTFVISAQAHAPRPVLAFLPNANYMANRWLRQYLKRGLLETNAFPAITRRVTYLASGPSTPSMQQPTRATNRRPRMMQALIRCVWPQAKYTYANLLSGSSQFQASHSTLQAVHSLRYLRVPSRTINCNFLCVTAPAQMIGYPPPEAKHRALCLLKSSTARAIPSRPSSWLCKALSTPVHASSSTAHKRFANHCNGAGHLTPHDAA